ncbi:MAG TPA: family 20 glycosylhydrolase [Terriglobales bacterium]|nr:family 20 glycosylhydrolase [Terriglobales bacterium]
MIRTAILCVLSILVTFPSSGYAQQSPLNLMPMPASVSMGTGQLVIDPSFSVSAGSHADQQLQDSVLRFLNDLRKETGMLPLDMKVADSANATLAIKVEHASKPVQELGEDESYTLEITSSGAKLSAPTTLGAMHGLQTFLQLVNTTSQGFAVPAVTIQDKPRFPWRGLMIDVGRHFIPMNILKRNLDGMAAVKLNVFHWHLSDNQGFRVESKKFPKLQEMGSDGMYYTQEEVREIIAYAHDRGIRVIPEFDIPGHATAWFVGYPELASGPGPYQIERKWGIFDPAVDPTNEHTYKFLDELIGEMTKLFPDQFFHIGGDEVNGKQWDANPKIQEFKRAHNIKDNAGLQAYFTARVQKLVSKHGKTTMGWDEILQPGFPKDVVIQSWRGQASLAQAAKLGYRGILSSGYYIDLIQSAAQHYSVDPMSGDAAKLSPEEASRILGGEATMWSEHVSPENIDSRIWPRTAAIAERLWSPQNVTDVNSMYQRLGETSRRLEWLGLTHNSSYVPMLRRIAGTEDISALKTLADVVEPVKGYAWERTSPVVPTSLMPLNRLIDAARPESATGREFANLVDAYVAGKAGPEAKLQIRHWLLLWRDNQAKLQPLEAQSFLMKEVIPVSQSLSTLATAGLEAMDYLDHGDHMPDTLKAAQLGLIQQAEKPQAQVTIAVAPSIQKLVEFSAGQTPTEMPAPEPD